MRYAHKIFGEQIVGQLAVSGITAIYTCGSTTGIIDVLVEGEKTEQFRIGPNEMWQWLTGDRWVGYSEYLKVLEKKASDAEIDQKIAQVEALDKEIPGVWKIALREMMQEVVRLRQVNKPPVKQEAHCPKCQTWTPDSLRVGKGCLLCGTTLVGVKTADQPA